MIRGIPGPSDHEIERPRLHDLLSSSRVVVVHAGRGAGKTTAVAAWARRAPADVAWVTVEADTAAHAAPRFWARLAESLPGVRPELPASGDASTTAPPDVRRALAVWASGLDRDLTIVVDDADEHVLTDLIWVAGESRNVRVIVTIGSPRIDAGCVPADVLVLGDRDVSFSSEEASSVLRSHGIDVGPGDQTAAALVRLTEGRASAVGAVARNRTHGRLRPEDIEPDPARWVLESALDGALPDGPLPPADPAAVVVAVAALFDRVSVSEIAELLTEADETIRVSLDRAVITGYGSWASGVDEEFQVLPAVRAAVGASTSLDRAVLSRAAALHARREEPFEAVTLAVAIGDLEAATTFGKQSFLTLLRHHTEPLLAQFSTIPLSTLSHHPLLVLFLAMLYSKVPRGRLAMLSHYARAEYLSRAGADRSRAADRAVVLIVRSAALRLTGRGDAARTAARQSVDALDAAPLVDVEGLGILRAALLGQATLAFFAAGDMDEARALAVRTATLDGVKPQMRQSAWSRSAFIEGVWGDIAGARDHLDAATRFEAWTEKFFVVPLSIARAMIAVEDAEFDDADALIADLGQRLQEVEYWPAGVVVRAFVHLTSGSPRRALEVLDTAEQNSSAVPSSAAARIVLGEVRAVANIAIGQIGEARAVVRRLPSSHRTGSVSSVLIRLADDEPVEAIAAASAGLSGRRSERTRTILMGLRAAAALRLGYGIAAERDVRLLLGRLRTTGLRSSWMLVPARDRAALDAFAREVGGDSALVDELDRFPSLIPDLSPIPSLTRRERMVLGGVVEGLTNVDIAARLGVSPNTVKKQRASAYGKLGATTREEAVRTALVRGLLDAP